MITIEEINNWVESFKSTPHSDLHNDNCIGCSLVKVLLEHPDNKLNDMVDFYISCINELHNPIRGVISQAIMLGIMLGYEVRDAKSIRRVN